MNPSLLLEPLPADAQQVLEPALPLSDDWQAIRETLATHGPLGAGEVAAATFMTRPRASQHLLRMEAERMVKPVGTKCHSIGGWTYVWALRCDPRPNVRNQPNPVR